jgi:hypothetical protein
MCGTSDPHIPTCIGQHCLLAKIVDIFDLALSFLLIHFQLKGKQPDRKHLGHVGQIIKGIAIGCLDNSTFERVSPQLRSIVSIGYLSEQ